MKERRHNIILVLLAACSLLISNVQADSAAKLVRKGNSLYSDGKYTEAGDLYDQAIDKKPESPEAKYNRAAAAYRDKDMDTAIDLFRDVAAQSKNKKLAATAKYNLGNSYFQKGKALSQGPAEQGQQPALDKAIESMEKAVDTWRQVQEMQPKNKNVTRNIEVGKLTINQLKKLMEQQQQQQQDDNNSGENKDKDKQDQKDQQNKDDQKKDEQNKDQQQQDQSKEDQQQQDQQDKQDEQQSDEEKQQDQQQQQNSQEQQEKDQQQQQMKEQQEQEEKQKAAQQKAEEILEQEKKARQQRMLMLRQKYQKVEKDW